MLQQEAPAPGRTYPRRRQNRRLEQEQDLPARTAGCLSLPPARSCPTGAPAGSRLGVAGREENAAGADGRTDSIAEQLKREPPASEIYDLFRPLPVVALLALLAVHHGEAGLRSRALLYLEKLADVEISIDGHDLLAMGIEAGPEVGRILRAVRMAKLDGKISTREEELALAGSLARKGE